MKEKQKIISYMNRIKNICCNVLNIPNDLIIKFGGSFKTESEQCVLHIENNIKEILINEKYFNNLGVDDKLLAFNIAHECRHYYQIVKGYDFNEYKNSIDTSLINYNNQIEEIDAHAFGSLMMKELFNLQILLPLDKDLLEKISKREKEIVKELTKK